MYISMFNSRFYEGGVQLTPYFIFSVLEKNYGTDN